MQNIALIFVLISVILHLVWNSIGKKTEPTLAFFSLAYGGSVLLFSPILLFDEKLSTLPASFWSMILATGLCQTIYLAGLAWAYKLGDISISYPIARALPVVLVATITMLFSLGSSFSNTDYLSFACISVGAFIIPIEQVKESTKLKQSLLFTLVAALGTTGYAIIDDIALKIMVTQAYDPIFAGLVYMTLQGLSYILWAIPVIMMVSSEKVSFKTCFKNKKTLCISTGLIISITYALVLFAMSYSDNVSFIVALRQLSIPLSIVVGIKFFKETKSKSKIIGSAIMFSGLLILAINR